MSIEIERKFLVKNNSFIKESHKVSSIQQGFLNSNKNRVVRVRLIDADGYITVKGISSIDGTSRFEWEKKISLLDAENLLKLCEDGIINKKRYLVSVENHTFEIDVFEDENLGLTIAEIELESSDECFKRPMWLGDEVTGEARYYNSSLSKHPFTNWD